MKKIIATSVLLAATSLSASSAYAGWHMPHVPSPTGCASNLCTNQADFKQLLTGMQKAIDLIVNVDDATKVVQNAVNAGNLITINGTVDVANIEQYAGVYGPSLNQFALNKLDGSSWKSDFTDITQSATNVVNSIKGNGIINIDQVAREGSQKASNIISGGYHSKFEDLVQSATNVVNTATASTSVKTIEQWSDTAQTATNKIEGGTRGYDLLVGTQVDWNAKTNKPELTQSAVNAANLATVGVLNGAIKQVSIYSPQTAINTAVFEGWSNKHQGTVYDLGQSATNVVNTVTYASFDKQLDCNCFGGWEVNQDAHADQYAKNLLKTVGDVDNIVQSATNVANSITVGAAAAATP